MVSPYARADESDHDGGCYHHGIAENRFPGKDRDHLRDDAERRQDQNIDLWVAKDPKEMLPQHWRTAGLGFEKLRPKESFQNQHDLRSRERRQKHDDQKHGHQDQPGKQWHPIEGHPLAAIAKDRHHDVHAAGDTADATNQNTERPKIDIVARRESARSERSNRKPGGVRRSAGSIQAGTSDVT